MTDRLTRLGALGARYRDPMTTIDWQNAEPELPWLPTAVLSLAGLEQQATMRRDTLIRFSRIEFARLCAAGLWLEGLLISRTASAGFLATKPSESRLVLQEVREESGHGLMFLEMIDRAGLAGVPVLGPTALLGWVARRLDPNGAAFWAMVYIGESVTDAFAIRALRESGDGGEAICPVARQVLALHHRDEARHIAVARALLEARVAAMDLLDRLAFAMFLRFLLRRLLHATLYPTPASLAALGLKDADRAAKAARACPRRRRLAYECAAPARAVIARTVGRAPNAAETERSVP